MYVYTYSACVYVTYIHVYSITPTYDYIGIQSYFFNFDIFTHVVKQLYN